MDGHLPPQERSNSLSSDMRTSKSIASLPSPPPAIPLPPLPPLPTRAQSSNLNVSSSTTTTTTVNSPVDVHGSYGEDAGMSAQSIGDHIRTVEKHLFAERQLTASLEDALADLETQGNRTKAEVEGWKKKALKYEKELASLMKERTASTRHSVLAVEEERNARKEAEAARARLEERMAALSQQQKKKKRSGFNCF